MTSLKRMVNIHDFLAYFSIHALPTQIPKTIKQGAQKAQKLGATQSIHYIPKLTSL